MSITKVLKYKGCSNIEIAKALSDLSKNLLSSCKKDSKLIELIMSLSVAAWNLSLFEDSDENYLQKIEKKLPQDLNDEYKLIFKTFLLNLIREKQNKYPDYLKGITSFNLNNKDGKLTFSVKALPVKPL
ncbi:MAG: hypothetical protein H6680_10340 [Desulfobacteraceae bacterium]|nr:hypothetical protein [Desulfobacteraceae bacterium]